MREIVRQAVPRKCSKVNATLIRSLKELEEAQLTGAERRGGRI
jgi:hypothetical protein